MKVINFVTIAQVGHEANRGYCRTIGDSSQLAWADIPQWEKEAAIEAVKFYWSLLDRGKNPSPSDLRIWKFHSVAANSKAPEQYLKDFIFLGIVEAFYRNYTDMMNRSEKASAA